jgi:dihydroorotase
MGLLLTGGYLLDQRTGEKVRRDVLLENDRIQRIAETIDPVGHECIAVNGHLIVPGFIDVHVHLRTPGFEYKETIATGTKAAARGGYSTVVCMPNTRPVLDSKEMIQFVYDSAVKEGSCRVFAYGAITKGELGEELTDMSALKEAGVIGFTDDGVGVQEAALMRRAMEQAAELDLPIVIHAEDESLAGNGCMNEGEVSRRLGLPGIPGTAESVHVARDILLAKQTGAHLHVCHISDADAVEMVRFAKSQGIRVTAEVTPHHLLLTDEHIDGTDANWKVNPPLRTERDRIACLEALLDGTIDMIATDHAPHTEEEKAKPFQTAPFGFVGLEFAFPLLYTHLVETGKMSLAQLVDKFTTSPANVFGLPGGILLEGNPADITVLDLSQENVIDPNTFASKGRNTPFKGMKVKGWPILTITAGKITYRA